MDEGYLLDLDIWVDVDFEFIIMVFNEVLILYLLEISVVFNIFDNIFVIVMFELVEIYVELEVEFVNNFSVLNLNFSVIEN